MNKKIIILAVVALIVSFSAGVFTQISLSGESPLISTELPSMSTSVLDYLQNDAVTVFTAVILSFTVFLMPLVIFMVIGKTFSLGFTAAYILTVFEEKGFGVLIAVLLPHGLFKIPIFMVIALISFNTASIIFHNRRNPKSLSQHLRQPMLYFLFSFLALFTSSLLEAFLLQGVL